MAQSCDTIFKNWKGMSTMSSYHNIMEDVVEEQYNAIKDRLDACSCEQCHSDIVALALNNLPPRYISTISGLTFSKVASAKVQFQADVQAALIRAAQIVKQSPRH